MENWEKLVALKSLWVQRGSVLRVPTKLTNDPDWYPDPWTDFLIFDSKANGAYGLIVLSGHKAGMISVVFPAESSLPGHVGLRREWLIENWNKWVYPNGSAEEVWIRNPEIQVSSVEFL